MNHPKLLPSQELVLHQVSVDSFSPATASVLKFPASPLLPRSSFTTPGTPTLSAPSATSPLTSSAAIAASSIVRPQIRLREEWEASLTDVDAFVLDRHFLHTTSFDRRDPVLVRYIADRLDRAWLSRRPVLTVRGEDGAVSMVRGKTGGLGSHMPVASTLHASLLEDVFTALEVAAYAHAEIPLERLLPYARTLLEDTEVSEEALEELHAYWLLRRHGAGGLLPAIPELRVTIREDNEMALCHAAVLRDCPLPFKQRDWYVPVVERRRPALLDDDAVGHKRLRADASSSGKADSSLDACVEYAEQALRLSCAMLEREDTRQAHTQLALYELAALRDAVRPEEEPPTKCSSGATRASLCRLLTATARHCVVAEGEKQVMGLSLPE